jgi:hypothetical protein
LVEVKNIQKINLSIYPTYHRSKEFNDHFKHSFTGFEDEYFIENFMGKLTTLDLICLNLNKQLNALLLNFYFFFKFKSMENVLIYHSNYFIPNEKETSKIVELHDNHDFKPNATTFIIPLLYKKHWIGIIFIKNKDEIIVMDSMNGFLNLHEIVMVNKILFILEYFTSFRKLDWKISLR